MKSLKPRDILKHYNITGIAPQYKKWNVENDELLSRLKEWIRSHKKEIRRDSVWESIYNKALTDLANECEEGR